MLRLYFSVIFVCSVVCASYGYPEKAVFRNPVVDVTMRPLASYGDDFVTFEHTISGESRHGCTRMAQGLFNEIVTVLDVWDEQSENPEVLIEIPHYFYHTNQSGLRKINQFWVKKSDLLFESELEQCGINFDIFPESISFNNSSSITNSDIITLTAPWYDPKTNKTYSAGTRFIHDHDGDSDTEFGIKFLDTSTLQLCYASVSDESIIDTSQFSATERQQVFVLLLKNWAVNDLGVVPFVWGGMSLTSFLPEELCTVQQAYLSGETITYWVRPSSSAPHSGFTCSSVILRAAQIAGLPFFSLTTRTMSEHLERLGKSDELQEGDIIWWPGGSVVVSGLDDNTMIVASSYHTGHGCLYETELKNYFENITTYEQLIDAYHNKKPLTVLDKDGLFVCNIDYCVIFKLSTVWDTI